VRSNKGSGLKLKLKFFLKMKKSYLLRRINPMLPLWRNQMRTKER
jgi:hypothetical protein